jgi:flagellar protein FlaG
MATDTIVNAILLTATLVMLGIIINVVMPSISSLSSTVETSTAQTVSSMATDVTITNTYYNATVPPYFTVWIKNTGQEKFSKHSINNLDIFIGAPGDYSRSTTFNPVIPEILDDPSADYWNPGETLKINITDLVWDPPSDSLYFAIVLPNGVQRSVTVDV